MQKQNNILNGLSRGEVDKVMHLSSAKEIWAAIQVVHAGPEDQ